MRRCNTCDAPIAPARVAALPAAVTCVACSTEQPVKGYMTWEHKTAPVFQVVNPAQHQWLQTRDRKGMRSGLPMSSRGMSACLLPVAYTPTTKPAVTRVLEGPMATRCAHKDRPQVSAAGQCVECALAYYRRKVEFSQITADKKVLQTP